MMTMIKKRTRNNTTESVDFATLLLPFVALIAPFLVWPIEMVLPYPHLIEELAKALMVLIIIRGESSLMKNVRFALLLGILFTVSETVLYSFNIYFGNTVQTVLQRLAFTTILHAGTLMGMTLAATYARRWLIGGLIAAVVIHYFYNLWVM